MKNDGVSLGSLDKIKNKGNHTSTQAVCVCSAGFPLACADWINWRCALGAPLWLFYPKWQVSDVMLQSFLCVPPCSINRIRTECRKLTKMVFMVSFDNL